MTETEALATGELKDTPFGGLLYSIFTRMLTGSLVVAESAERRHCVSFRDGYPTKAKLVDPMDLLGEILFEAGSLTPEQIAEILDYSEQLELLCGESALMLGYVETDALNQALVVQTARRVARLFTVFTGTYGFYQEDFLSSFGGNDPPTVDPLPIIAAGVRSSYDLGRLILMLQGLQDQPLATKASPEIIQRFRFSEPELSIATALQKNQTLAELMATSGQPQTTVYGVVHCLHMTSLLELGQSAVTMPPPPASPPRNSPQPHHHESRPVPSAPPQPHHHESQPVPSSPPQPPPQSPSVHPSATPQRSSPPPQARVSSPPSSVTPSQVSIPRSETPPPPASDEPKSARRIEADELIAKGDKATFFELLNITREATARDVQIAWASRAKQFHPDKATGDLADLRPQLEQLMARITVAKDTLKDDEKRRDYLNSLDLSFDGKLMGPKTSRAPSHEDNLVRQALEADEAFMKAKILLKRNQFKEAEEHARIAVKSDQENGDYMALLAWVESRQRPRKGNFDDLLQSLREAVKLAPRSEDAHFYFAQLLYQTGKLRKALSEFEETMDLNTDNIDAVRMVRILRKKKAEAIRKRKEQKSGGGLLASLFGDKKK